MAAPEGRPSVAEIELKARLFPTTSLMVGELEFTKTSAPR